MKLADSVMVNDVVELFLAAKPVPPSIWECYILTPQGKYAPIKLKTIEIDRNYQENWGDIIDIEVTLPLGLYNSEIKPFKDQLTLELIRRKITDSEESEEVDVDYSRRLKLITRDESDQEMESNAVGVNNTEVMDRSQLIDVTFQALDLVVEKLRLFEVGGIYRNAVPADVLRYILTDVASRLNLELEDSIRGVDLVEPNNKKPSENIIVPHGTRPQDLVELIQKYCGGVYSTGIAQYVQDGLWYVWPLYNTKRFDDEFKTLHILNIPPTELPAVERTWLKRDQGLVVLSTGVTKHISVSNIIQMNLGNGVRYTHATQLLQGFGKQGYGSLTDVKDTTTRKGNKCIITRADNNSEYYAIERGDFNYAPVSEDRITDNPFVQTSRLAKRFGSTFFITWENSVPELLYPGMPTKITYRKENDIVEVFGTLLEAKHLIQDLSDSPRAGKQVSTSMLTVFLEPK